MTDIYYPKRLPGPLLAGYGLTPVSPLRRDEMTSGRRRSRRLYTSVPSRTPVTWVFRQDAQARLFEAWYRDILQDGANWFFITLRTPLGVKPYKCRFDDIYEGPIPVDGTSWKFTATLELFERPILSPGWGSRPDTVLDADKIDIAVNKQWPSP